MGKTTTECSACGQRKVTWNDCCANCGAELTHVFDDGDRQYRKAGEVVFHGGYGMFFDDDPRRRFLCHSCTEEMCDSYPWIERLIR